MAVYACVNRGALGSSLSQGIDGALVVWRAGQQANLVPVERHPNRVLDPVQQGLFDKLLSLAAGKIIFVFVFRGNSACLAAQPRYLDIMSPGRLRQTVVASHIAKRQRPRWRHEIPYAAHMSNRQALSKRRLDHVLRDPAFTVQNLRT